MMYILFKEKLIKIAHDFILIQNTLQGVLYTDEIH